MPPRRKKIKNVEDLLTLLSQQGIYENRRGYPRVIRSGMNARYGELDPSIRPFLQTAQIAVANHPERRKDITTDFDLTNPHDAHPSLNLIRRATERADNNARFR